MFFSLNDLQISITLGSLLILKGFPSGSVTSRDTPGWVQVRLSGRPQRESPAWQQARLQGTRHSGISVRQGVSRAMLMDR